MMNKLCFVLIAAMCPATLFAGETMVTKTTAPTGPCNFRVDKCETSVATDPSYQRYKDGTASHSTTITDASGGDNSRYNAKFIFADYANPKQDTIEELLALIRSKLSNCPEVSLCYDEDTGDITIHYLKTSPNCGCDCDWVINVRNVKGTDFVWTRTKNNYSEYLGQMERRKFHTTSEEDAQKIEVACGQICKINSWSPIK